MVLLNLCRCNSRTITPKYRTLAVICVLVLLGFLGMKSFGKGKPMPTFRGYHPTTFVKRGPDFDFEGRQHDDPALIEYIRALLVFPPSHPLPYNLVHPETRDFAQRGQGPALTKIFGTKRNGFFIEAGGFTGEEYSPTLFWEREHNWTGILIEPHPYFFSILSSKNRRAITLNAGISPTNTAQSLTFIDDGWGTTIVKSVVENPEKAQNFTVPCFPLTSILAALGTPTVDLFSLDVERIELHVLRTMNLTLLNIHSFLIECLEHCEVIQQYMESVGYRLFVQLPYDGVYVQEKFKTVEEPGWRLPWQDFIDANDT